MNELNLHANAHLVANRTGDMAFIVGPCLSKPTVVVRCCEFKYTIKNMIHWIVWPGRKCPECGYGK